MTTNELKKKHEDLGFFVGTVAPDSQNKYFSSILVFYKDFIIKSGSKTHSNYLRDCVVYGKRSFDLECELIGNVDEFFQCTSTFVSYTMNGKFILHNVVSNKTLEIGSGSDISIAARKILRIASPEIFKKTIEIKDLEKIAMNYDKLIETVGGYIIVVKNDLYGLVSKRGELIPCVFRWARIHGGSFQAQFESSQENFGFPLEDLLRSFYLQKYRLIPAVFGDR